MFNTQKIVAEIEEEAKKRFDDDAICPGGLTAKLYSVSMEIDLAVGELMKNSNEGEK